MPPTGVAATRREHGPAQAAGETEAARPDEIERSLSRTYGAVGAARASLFDRGEGTVTLAADAMTEGAGGVGGDACRSELGAAAENGGVVPVGVRLPGDQKCDWPVGLGVDQTLAAMAAVLQMGAETLAVGFATSCGDGHYAAVAAEQPPGSQP